jgi:hypothetical protein
LNRVNVSIATNVVEEGIYVPQCNNISCLNKIEHIKEFIQKFRKTPQYISYLKKLQLYYTKLRTNYDANKQWNFNYRETKHRRNEIIPFLEQANT